MRKLIFIFMLALVVFACVSACASFSSSNKIGTQVEFDGGTAFCTYDQDVKTESFSQDTTCSFTVKAGDVIYQCEKIKLANINKAFSLETNCAVILDMKNKTTQKSQQSAILSDFKTSGKVSETLNFYAYNLNLTTGVSGVSNYETCGNAPADWG